MNSLGLLPTRAMTKGQDKDKQITFKNRQAPYTF